MKTDKKISIKFLGAAGTVTGSKIYIKTPTQNILVDCGLFQGLKELRLMNWEPLPIDVSEIDYVLLTHGHLDHVGYLPRLVKNGFKGEIIASSPTLDVATIILKDSARIQEEDAERANRQAYSKHKPALPLYDTKDVEKTLKHFVNQALDTWVALDESVSVRFRYNAHIIGATFIELKINEKVFVFSGDVGRESDLVMAPPDKPLMADVLFIESTYGDRIHPTDAEEKLTTIINETYNRGGTLIIPGFAVERIQLMMYLIWQLKNKKAIPDVPVYMDSPMGRGVLDVFIHHKAWHKVSLDEFKQMCEHIHIIEKIDETNNTVSKKEPKIIIAGSGMATGGRVLSYLQHYLPKPASTVLLAGYQAEGTRGRRLLDGESEIKMFGKMVKVKAQISSIGGLSAHADQQELLGWMNELKQKPEKIFIVHGEENSRKVFKSKIKERYGWDAIIPQLNESFEIELI
jgi:metallo-beta-lactamase family protein